MMSFTGSVPSGKATHEEQRKFLVGEITEMAMLLDVWITRCERHEEEDVRAEVAEFLEAPEAHELPRSVLSGMQRATVATDRILTALSLLSALDGLTGRRSGASPSH